MFIFRSYTGKQDLAKICAIYVHHIFFFCYVCKMSLFGICSADRERLLDLFNASNLRIYISGGGRHRLELHHFCWSLQRLLLSTTLIATVLITSFVLPPTEGAVLRTLKILLLFFLLFLFDIVHTELLPAG